MGKLRANSEIISDKSKNPVTTSTYIKHGNQWLDDAVNNAIGAAASKADKTYVDSELTKKANKSDTDAALSSKADKSALEATNASVSANTSNIQELSTESTVLSARMDEFTKLEEGSTTGDAELIDGRIGSDGKTYDNIGGAIRGQVTDLKSDLDDYKDSISEYHKSVNLFDKSKITDGKILSSKNNEQTMSSCFYTDYIPYETGKTYCFQDNTGYLGQNGKIVCIYDENKNFITTISQNDIVVRDGAVIFPTLAGSLGRFVRVNGRTSRLDSFMFVEGETLPEYEPYYAPCYEIKENVLPRFVKTVNGVTPDENGNVNTNSDGNVLYNPLYGKKLCVDGDSIMYGAGSSGGFAKIIGGNNSMTVVNNAVSGGTIASGTYHSDGTTARHWICDTIKNIPSDADYILFDGGVNDSSETAEVGAISNGFSAELDTTTFCGAMESICKWLVINRPNAKTGYVIVHKMAGNYTSEYPVDGQRDLYILAIKICEKWGIPYIDLNTQVPPLKDIQSLRDVYTSNADGWHPNELGYKTFYVPKIEAFLRTL